YVMQWTMKYLRANKLDDRFNRRFRNVADYPGLRIFRRTFDSVSQWTGIEYRQMARFLVAILIPVLTKRSGDPISDEASQILSAVKSMTELVLFCSQRAHSDYTLQWLDKTLNLFYARKSVFRFARKTPAAKIRFEKAHNEAINKLSTQARRSEK